MELEIWSQFFFETFEPRDQTIYTRIEKNAPQNK